MLLHDSPREGPLASREQPATVDPHRRRGTTAMEYLFVSSLILVVVITGIGYFGQMLKASSTATTNAIKNATKNK